MRILTVNAGSSSLKLSLLDRSDEVLGQTTLPALAGDSDAELTTDFTQIAEQWDPDAVAHRIVHGGSEYTGATVVDSSVEARLRELTDLAPLHQPKSLAALDFARRHWPGVPHVACFDTAFHAGMPDSAATYALPKEWRSRWGLRRFGFHGLSHAYASRRATQMLSAPADSLRLVTCHLGAGASLCAVLGGRSVDTTMGFTPLEGLVMATRSGTVDPGLLLWLQERVGLPAGELAATLEHRSGLLALAGTADMRAVLAAATAGDPDAVTAREVYLHRLRSGIAAMAAATGGVDAIVFTGGVGENSADIRQRAADGLGFLGIRIDGRRNQGPNADREISRPGASVRSLVVLAREDLQMAHETRALLGGTGPGKQDRGE